MNLIPYAGFETPRPVPPRGPSKHKIAPLSPLQLFRKGWDTQAIAAYWRISEPEALRRLNIERSNKLHLPNPYGGKI